MKSMIPTQEDIAHQQILLAGYRRNLAHSLRQREELRDTYIPHKINTDIHNAREHIRQCKEMLRGWGIEVRDELSDEGSTADTQFRSVVLTPQERRNRQAM